MFLHSGIRGVPYSCCGWIRVKTGPQVVLISSESHLQLIGDSVGAMMVVSSISFMS